MTAEDKNGQIHKVKTLSITTFFKKISHRRSKYNTKFLKVCAKKVHRGSSIQNLKSSVQCLRPVQMNPNMPFKNDRKVAFRYQWRSSKKQLYLLKHLVFIQVRERLHISLLLSREFKRISLLLCPLKLLDNLWFTDYFRGIRSYFTEWNFIFIPCAWRTKRKFLNPHSFEIVNERTSF